MSTLFFWIAGCLSNFFLDSMVQLVALVIFLNKAAAWCIAQKHS